jgi:hypothetical protein
MRIFKKEKIGLVDGEGAFILDQARGRTTQPQAYSSKG